MASSASTEPRLGRPEEDTKRWKSKTAATSGELKNPVAETMCVL